MRVWSRAVPLLLALLAVSARADDLQDALAKIEPDYKKTASSDASFYQKFAQQNTDRNGRPLNFDWYKATLGNLILRSLAGLPVAPQDQWTIEIYKKKNGGNGPTLPPPLKDPGLAVLKNDLDCRVGNCSGDASGITPDFSRPQSLITSNESLMQQYLADIKAVAADAPPARPSDQQTQTQEAPNDAAHGPNGLVAGPTGTSPPGAGGPPTEPGPPPFGSQAFGGTGSSGSGGVSADAGLGGHDIGSHDGGAALGAAKQGFGSKVDTIAGPGSSGGGGAPGVGGRSGSTQGPAARAAGGLPGASGDVSSGAPGPVPSRSAANAGTQLASTFSPAPAASASPRGGSWAVPRQAAREGPAPAPGAAPSPSSAGTEGGASESPSPLKKPDEDVGRDLTDDEKKELAEIQKMLKDAAESGSLDGPKLEDALARLPSDASPALSAVEEKVARMLGMVGRELTMAERQEVMALASQLQLSTSDTAALPPAVEHGTPPAPGRFAGRRPRWERWWSLIAALVLLAAGALILGARGDSKTS